MYYQNLQNYYHQKKKNNEVREFTCTQCNELKFERPNFNDTCMACVDKNAKVIAEMFGE